MARSIRPPRRGDNPDLFSTQAPDHTSPPPPKAVTSGLRRQPRPKEPAHTGIRLAMAALCAGDPRLTHNARHWFVVFAWRYRPGQRFRDDVQTLAPGLMSRPAVYRAVECLAGHGYVRRVNRGALRSPLIDALVDMPGAAVDERQMAFAFLQEADKTNGRALEAAREYLQAQTVVPLVRQGRKSH